MDVFVVGLRGVPVLDVDRGDWSSDLPVSEQEFLAAVNNSRFATEIGFKERIAAEVTISQCIQPSDFATVNLLFYDEAYDFSIRWFIWFEEEQWKLYDWENLGCRMLSCRIRCLR